MAGAARDFGIVAFGLALAPYATLFCWLMMKTTFDKAKENPASAPCRRNEHLAREPRSEVPARLRREPAAIPHVADGGR
jgi:hypothetical protein